MRTLDGEENARAWRALGPAIGQVEGVRENSVEADDAVVQTPEGEENAGGLDLGVLSHNQ